MLFVFSGFCLRVLLTIRIILPLKPESELMLDSDRVGHPTKCFSTAGRGKVSGKKTPVKALGGDHQRPLAVNSVIPGSV